MMSTQAAKKTGQKEYSGRLPFRTSAEIHQRIAEATKKQDCKSINAWMEKVLSEAASDVLGLDSNEGASEVTSPAIRWLLNDTDEAAAEWVGELISVILVHLEKSDPLTIIRFNTALKKFLIGLDALRSQLGPLDREEIAGKLSSLCEVETADALMVSLFGILLEQDDQRDLWQLNNAFKLLSKGVRAIYPMLKLENRPYHLCKIFEEIEVALQKFEGAQ